MSLKQAVFHQESEIKKTRVKEIDQRIGLILKEIRNLKKLNQTDLADILDVSCQQFQKYEKGTNRISFASMLILSHALKIPLNEFAVEVDDSVVGLSDNEQEGISGYAAEKTATIKENKEILKLFNSIEDTKTRKYLLKFMKGVVDTKQNSD